MSMAKHPTPKNFLEHLLQCLYSVDAPAKRTGMFMELTRSNVLDRHWTGGYKDI